MKKDIVEFPEEKKRSGFYLRFITCFIILSLLELGACHIWSSFNNQVPAESSSVLASRSQFHGEKGCLEITKPFENPGSKSILAIFIIAMLLNAAISEYVAARLTRTRTEKEELQEILRRHAKSL